MSIYIFINMYVLQIYNMAEYNLIKLLEVLRVLWAQQILKEQNCCRNSTTRLCPMISHSNSEVPSHPPLSAASLQCHGCGAAHEEATAGHQPGGAGTDGQPWGAANTSSWG